MPVETLKRFLDDHHVRYVTIRHSPAYTAQEIAASAHIPGQELAKTVILEIDGALAMAVLPASEHVEIGIFSGLIGANHVALASESRFAERFPDCEPGAMPPFGNLYGMRVFVAKDLTKDDVIAFNAGTHTELIQLAFEDYLRLVEPEVVDFAAETAAY